MLRDAFLDTADVAARLVRDPAVAARWREPSALVDFSVAGLARHLANQITTMPGFLARPPGTAPVPVLDHYTRNSWVVSGVDSDDNRSIRGRSEERAAGTTPEALADEVDGALAELRRVLPALPGDRIVPLGDWALTLDDLLLTRLMELVVHGDDLAVSIGVPTPPVPDEAADATIVLLARVATWRHGSLAVIRALSRRERAPETISAL